MEETQVGEYIRTDNGEIFKVLEVEKGSVKIKSDYREWIGICSIKIHSFNIIDLIEVGDYVNGEKVIRLFNPTFLSMGELSYLITEKNKFEEYEIKSIVTKEQFENIKYKLEE